MESLPGAVRQLILSVRWRGESRIEDGLEALLLTVLEHTQGQWLAALRALADASLRAAEDVPEIWREFCSCEDLDGAKTA